MGNWLGGAKGFLGGGGAGAGIGLAVGGPLGAGIGAGIGALAGGVLGLFDSDPEQEARNRRDEFIRAAEKMKWNVMARRDRMLGEAKTAYGKAGAGLMRTASGAAASRAYAMGAPGKVEAGVLGATAPIPGEISRGLSTTLSGINRQADEDISRLEAAQLNFEGGFADRPGNLNLADTLLTIGPEVGKFGAQMDYIKRLQGLLPESKTDYTALDTYNEWLSQFPR